MKQKNIRYFLITGVLLVWGIIIYRVINALSGSDTILKPAMTKPVVSAYAIKADSFFLYANYPDPFNAEEETTDSLINSEQNKQASTPPSTFNNTTAVETDLSFIQYHGMIANPATKMKAAMLSIKGKEFTAREKDLLENIYRVNNIYAQKIVITYRNKRYEIEKIR